MSSSSSASSDESPSHMQRLTTLNWPNLPEECDKTHSEQQPVLQDPNQNFLRVASLWEKEPQVPIDESGTPYPPEWDIYDSGSFSLKMRQIEESKSTFEDEFDDFFDSGEDDESEVLLPEWNKALSLNQKRLDGLVMRFSEDEEEDLTDMSHRFIIDHYLDSFWRRELQFLGCLPSPKRVISSLSNQNRLL
eukprot:GHVH01005474.1.p1 GENE.GHVH01005474.1~~GHVH01005474.1.p1  ORF type:complete len:210 (+),score=33.84 GHVH01005474.1:59-631(+)